MMINPIFYLVTLTLVNGVCFLDKKSLSNKIIMIILINYFLTELVSIYLNYNNIAVGLLFNISILLQFSMWILLLLTVFKKQKNIFIYLYLCLALMSLWNHFNEFNNVNFIIGTAIYASIYISESFKLLQNENLAFFQTNLFLLISAPLIFFFGLSLMFAFNTHELSTHIVFFNIKLYTFINYFVNIVCYTLINYFIFKEKKIKND